MKRFICLLFVLVLIPIVSFSSDIDPIIGSWYIMLDYNEIPPTADSAGKEYMLFVIIFDETGNISCVTAESLENIGLYANGSILGTWSNNDGKYIVNMIGVGSNSAEFSDDRLLLQMTPTVWYSMQRLNKGSWYTDIIVRPLVNQ